MTLSKEISALRAEIRALKSACRMAYSHLTEGNKTIVDQKALLAVLKRATKSDINRSIK